MQTALILLLVTASFAAVFLLAGGVGAIAPAPAKPEELLQNRITLSIGEAVAWDGSPVEVSVLIQGEPESIAFVIEFEPHLVRVVGVESSASWEARVVRSNERGEVIVRADRVRPVAGTHRLLTFRFRRVAEEDGKLTIPQGSVDARFPTEGPFTVTVVPGVVRAPRF